MDYIQLHVTGKPIPPERARRRTELSAAPRPGHGRARSPRSRKTASRARPTSRRRCRRCSSGSHRAAAATRRRSGPRRRRSPRHRRLPGRRSRSSAAAARAGARRRRPTAATVPMPVTTLVHGRCRSAGTPRAPSRRLRESTSPPRGRRGRRSSSGRGGPGGIAREVRHRYGILRPRGAHRGRATLPPWRRARAGSTQRRGRDALRCLRQARTRAKAPLADRMRPRTLADWSASSPTCSLPIAPDAGHRRRTGFAR